MKPVYEKPFYEKPSVASLLVVALGLLLSLSPLASASPAGKKAEQEVDQGAKQKNQARGAEEATEVKPSEVEAGAKQPGDGEPSAENEAATSDDGGLKIPFEKYELENGLEVILHEDHSTPFVAVSVWYHVGAFDEPQGRSGFAHLFEHLMFQGTPNVGDDKHIAYLEQAGASVRKGMVNGTTSEDRTNYFEVLPSAEVALALWLEADRMGYLMDGVTQAKLDEQRKVVKNERLQGTENRAYGMAKEALWQRMFPRDHPYYGRVIGSLQELDKASLEDVAGFYDTYYAPANATLCVAGDFEPAALKEMIKKYFATLPPWEKPAKKKVAAPTLQEPILIEFDEPIGKLSLVKISWFTPALYAPGDAELDILSHVLTGGKSSVLYKSLVDEAQVAQSVSARQGSMGNVSVFSIEIVVRDGKNPQDALDTTMAHLEEMQYLPPEAEKIKQAVDTLETSRIFGLQKVGSFGGKAEQLQSYNHFTGDPGYLAQDMARYRAVTPESIGEILQKFLTQQSKAVLMATPKAEPGPKDDAETPAGGAP